LVLKYIYNYLPTLKFENQFIV